MSFSVEWIEACANPKLTGKLWGIRGAGSPYESYRFLETTVLCADTRGRRAGVRINALDFAGVARI